MPFECINLSSMKAKGFSVPKVKLTADDIRGVFDPTVHKIQTLVDEQVRAVKLKTEARPKVRSPVTIERSQMPLGLANTQAILQYVIMVGGFGRCQYLFASLKKHLGDGIEVLQSRGSGPYVGLH
jgi:hypothetical protein